MIASSLFGCNSIVYNGITYTSSTVKRDTTKSIGGCDSIYKVATIIVSSYPTIPAIVKTGNTTFCLNDSLVLTDATTGNFQWLRNGTAIKNATTARYVVRAAGTYKLKVTNTTGCATTSADSVVAVVNQMAQPTISLVNDILISSSATTYQWYQSNLLIPGT